VKEVDRHLFFDKVKFLGIDSCLYEISKNDWVDDMKLWSPVTFPDVYCYLIVTPVDFTGKKLKAYNFVILGMGQVTTRAEAEAQFCLSFQ